MKKNTLDVLLTKSQSDLLSQQYKLKQCFDEIDHSRRQIEQLNEWIFSYHDQWSDLAAKGLDSASLNSYRLFIDKLKTLVTFWSEQHNTSLAHGQNLLSQYQQSQQYDDFLHEKLNDYLANIQRDYEKKQDQQVNDLIALSALISSFKV